jgi:transposase-like protein
MAAPSLRNSLFVLYLFLSFRVPQGSVSRMRNPDDAESREALPSVQRSAAGESQYDPAFVSAICARVARGESLRSICRDPAMPTVQTLSVWRRREPEFERALEAARRTARAGAEERRQALRNEARNQALRRREGLFRNPGRTSAYSKMRADNICLRIAEGESLEAICQNAAVPCVATVYNWLRWYPEFGTAYSRARQFRMDRLGERMVELADGATAQSVGVIRLHVDVLKAEARRMGDVSRFSPDPQPVFNVTTVRWADIKDD